MDIRDEIARRKKDNWFEVVFTIEALAKMEDVVKNSLAHHVEKLSSTKDLFAYEKKFSEIRRVKNPLPNIDEAFSQIVHVKFFVKDIRTLLITVLTYGPSSVEILGPNKKEINLREVQDITNDLAGLVHQFAAAGIGGIVITPDRTATNSKN